MKTIESNLSLSRSFLPTYIELSLSLSLSLYIYIDISVCREREREINPAYTEVATKER